MARSWLEVTTDEVQSKQGANERLAERRQAMAERARGVVASVVAPAFKQAAEQRQWQYREDQDTEWSVVRCGIYSSGEAGRDPTVAFHTIEFDAYQPLVILRRKAAGAAAQPTSRIVNLNDFGAADVEAFLADD